MNEKLHGLQIIFILLKIFGIIEWNWFLVFSPYILIVVLFILCLLIIIFEDYIGGFRVRQRNRDRK
jgi:membrane protein YdbS with pleckstrin-like domain